MAEAYPGLAPQRDAERAEALDQPQRPTRPGSGDGGQALSEDAAWAGTITAKPFADAQLEGHPILHPRQVGERAGVGTMDAPRQRGAQRTGRAGLGRLHPQNELRGGLIDLARLQVQQGRIG